MSPSPSRKQRRRLERRADKLIEELRGHMFDLGRDATPRDLAVLLTNGAPPTLVHRSSLRNVGDVIGLRFVAIDDALGCIASDPRDDGLRLPALILLEGWLQVAWIAMKPLSRGSEALS